MSELDGRHVHFVVIFDTATERFAIEEDETADIYKHGQVWRERSETFEPNSINEDLIDDTTCLLEHLLKEAA